jgi:hypothetical protein
VRFAGHDDFDGFYEWAIAAGYAPGLCLDRFDRERDFEPRNCRWVPRKEIMDRRPRSQHFVIAAFGERKSLSEWVRDARCTIRIASLSHRLYRGWPPEQAISFPSGQAPTHFVKPPKRPDRSHLRGHIDWTEAVRLYTREGATLRELVERYGASHSGIRGGLEQRGVRIEVRRPHTIRRETLALAKTWSRMRGLSADPKSAEYLGPDRRGALLCREWQALEGFLAWAKPRRKGRGTCLVRKDPGKPYSPANCAWMPASQVKHHTHVQPGPRPALRLITAFGETKGLAAWGRDPRTQVSMTTICDRLARGMATEEAISLPGRAGNDGSPRMLVTAFGIEKCPAEWLRDPRCKLISMAGLMSRLARG